MSPINYIFYEVICSIANNYLWKVRWRNLSNEDKLRLERDLPEQVVNEFKNGWIRPSYRNNDTGQYDWKSLTTYQWLLIFTTFKNMHKDFINSATRVRFNVLLLGGDDEIAHVTAILHSSLHEQMRSFIAPSYHGSWKPDIIQVLNYMKWLLEIYIKIGSLDHSLSFETFTEQLNRYLNPYNCPTFPGAYALTSKVSIFKLIINFVNQVGWIGSTKRNGHIKTGTVRRTITIF